MNRLYVLVRWAYGFAFKEKEMLLRNIRAGPFPKPKGVIPDREIEAAFPYHLVAIPQSPANEGNTTSRNPPSTENRNDLSSSVQRSASGNTRNDVPRTVSADVENAVPNGPQNVTAHDMSWSHQTLSGPVNNEIPRRDWSVRGESGLLITPGTAPPYLAVIDYFFMMFPMSHLIQMTMLTNQVLRRERSRDTTCGELLKFFGALIMLTRVKFGSRREVWSTTTDSEYLPPISFGKVMPLHRFECLIRCIWFSNQPQQQGNLSSSGYRWKLCEDFMEAINMHRLFTVQPSKHLCVDESISRWYGIGGSWISKGLPHYVSIDRKPESGCEIQNIADADGGFILRMMFVKSAEDNAVDDGDAQIVITHSIHCWHTPMYSSRQQASQHAHRRRRPSTETVTGKAPQVMGPNK